MSKRKYNILLYCVVALLLLELCLRLFVGLGHIPVYVRNAQYEYMYAPNQDVYRFGKHIQTNSLGMRSPEPGKKDGIRILKIGDSVINGGAHVDQDKLSSTLLARMLTRAFAAPVSVYNVSAQSWGPDNAFAFLKAHGDFNAGMFVLVFSSHDLHDNMHFKNVVGYHNAWPAKQPLCATTDLLGRYIWPRVQKIFGAKADEYDYLYDFDDSTVNPGWAQLIQYARQRNIQLLVYLHASLPELNRGKYNKYGLQLIEMLKTDSIPVIQGIHEITGTDCYRDAIHLNEKGHAQLAKSLYPYLQKYVEQKLGTQLRK